ncbi:HRDC domain protein [Candidatus Izimaplasma bacterium HR1]|jgi:superfamily I DNA and/or RNA helicase|uniref:AAA domain-containing protein n=1 Tax=Candidatus Izimoplasma sp. HR1 TaxID=1541959 RepID=UPI0004F58C1C|nr:HRDC domain protein [Candidatus Izimaplasma bacterium HR1]
MDKKMLLELTNLRDKLKRKNKGSSICSDSSLMEINTYRPTRVEDFSGIRGIGEVFIEKYASHFLRLLDDNRTTDDLYDLDDKEVDFIERLENRLVNISKRNPNIYLGGTTSLNYSDLEAIDDFNIIEKLYFDKKKRVVELVNSNKNGFDEKKYKEINKLYRALNREKNESGEYNLYIAYPFVEGSTFEDKFDLNAPLAYFPIKLEKGNGRFTIVVDNNRTVILNETLIITSMKFILKKEVQIESLEIDVTNIKFDDFEKYLIDKYEKYGIKLSPSTEKKHNVLLGKSTISLDYGYRVRNYMILGRFSSFSNSIHKDVKFIKQARKTNKSLYDILFTTERGRLEKELNPDWNLSQINKLDYSQLQVVNAVDSGQSLIIEGPPGTGKSQTIVSIITNEISKDNNVIMLAEKKAAIDVIHSRLGRLRDYSIVIDDPNNKVSFYNQIGELLRKKIKAVNVSRKENNNILRLDNEIRKNEKILKSLNSEREYGITLLELQSIYEKIEIKDELSKHYTTIAKMIGKCFGDYTYNETFRLLTYLFNESKEDLEYMRNVMETKTHITYLNGKLDYSEFIDVNNIGDEYRTKLNERTFIKKFFTNIQFSFKLRKFASKKQTKNLKKYLLINNYCDEDFTAFEKFYEIFEEFSSQEKAVQNFYYSFIEYQAKNELILSYNQILKLYGNYLIRIIKSDIKSELQMFGKFDRSDKLLKKAYEDLIRYNLLRLETELFEQSEEVKLMKRYTAMVKAISSKRKPTISLFIEKYRFELIKLIRIWLTTPNVVSTLLPMESNIFNLAIFDEASQMYFEKSLPTLYRAERVVVAGDLKQLRPSNFGFGRLEGINDDDYILEDYSITDDDSLLDYVKPKLASVNLQYHYRSRYQELINLSNYVFYNRELIVPPYKSYDDTVKPIEYIKVDNGIWKNKTNKVEAYALVEKLHEILKRNNDKETVGIITFNRPQRDLIEDIIEEKCNVSPEFKELYEQASQKVEDHQNVGLFVKNIENVQGDERDIIIISVGYSYDEKGVFQRQFGWLSQKFGENRLNVCVTRAKRKLVMFVSFDLVDFKVDDLKNEGPKVLKKYLEYAKIVSNDDYSRSVTYLNRLTATEEIKEVSHDLQLSLPDIELLNVKEIHGSPTDYIIRNTASDKELSLVVNKLNDTYQKDHYFLKNYLNAVQVPFVYLNMYDWWENKEHVLNEVSKRLGGTTDV